MFTIRSKCFNEGQQKCVHPLSSFSKQDAEHCNRAYIKLIICEKAACHDFVLQIYVYSDKSLLFSLLQTITMYELF